MAISLDSGPSLRSLWPLAEVLRCPQSYANRYLRDKRLPVLTQPRDALTRGSLIHIGCAHFNARKRAAQRGEDPEAYLPPLDAVREAAERQDAERFLPECLRAVEGYARRWIGDPTEILHVEEPFDIKLTLPNGNIHDYTQRPDWIGRRGGVYINDIKSTAVLTDDTIVSYALTLQMLSYRVLGPLLFGDAFGGIIIDAVCWTSGVYRRALLDPAPEMVRQFPSIIANALDLIERYKDLPSDRWPRVANAENCFHRYGKCDWWELCAWGSQDPEVDSNKVNIEFRWLE